MSTDALLSVTSEINTEVDKHIEVDKPIERLNFKSRFSDVIKNIFLLYGYIIITFVNDQCYAFDFVLYLKRHKLGLNKKKIAHQDYYYETNKSIVNQTKTKTETENYNYMWNFVRFIIEDNFEINYEEKFNSVVDYLEYVLKHSREVIKEYNEEKEKKKREKAESRKEKENQKWEKKWEKKKKTETKNINAQYFNY
jgi:hypothetical protein